VKRSSYPRPVARALKVTALVSIAMLALLFAVVQRGQRLRTSRFLHQLPSTARAVLRVETGTLAGTAAARTLLDAFIAEEQLSEIERVCFLDPLASLSDATVWVRGPDEQPFHSIGLMLRGRSVDSARLAECYRQLVEGRGGSIIRLETTAGPLLVSRDRRSAIAQLDERTIVTGSVETVTEILSVQRGTVPSLVQRTRLAALWAKVGGGACIAAVFDPPKHWKAALERVADVGDGASAMEGVQGIALAVESGSEQTIKFHIEIADAERATRDAGLIRAWSHSPPESIDPRWVGVLRSARVQVRGDAIVGTLDVSSLSKVP